VPKEGEISTGHWRCPRCGSREIDEQHTDGLDRRYVELLCESCNFYGSFHHGDAGEKEWL
jgi:predicted RNA-binding Zn-ribbon protein involved in translation (DUF1610 family)